MIKIDIEEEIALLFTGRLHRILKDRIKGTINVLVENDTLKVVIFDVYNQKYVFAFNHFIENIHMGLYAEELAHMIMRDYRNYINGIYFK